MIKQLSRPFLSGELKKAVMYRQVTAKTSTL